MPVLTAPAQYGEDVMATAIKEKEIKGTQTRKEGIKACLFAANMTLY